MVAIEGVRGGKGDLEGRSQLRRRTAGKRYAAFAVAAFDVRDPGEHAFLTTRGGAIDQITQIAGEASSAYFSILATRMEPSLAKTLPSEPWRATTWPFASLSSACGVMNFQ